LNLKKRFVRSVLALIFGTIIFAGVPILSWGIKNINQFFEHPARALYVITIVSLQIFSVLYIPFQKKKADMTKSGLKQYKADLILIQVFSILIILIAPYSDAHAIGLISPGGILRYAGLVFLIFGFCLMQASEKHLGKQFSVKVTIQQNHRLVTTGPYKAVRHPRYLGIIVFFMGISLIFNSFLSLAVEGVLVIILLWRISAEESLMQKEFGHDWDDYRSKSWRLIPFLF
jgi:protein-S-isoprenylcysteine O-methyltransferase Ste14